MADFFEVEKNKVKEFLLEEYLNFGGYPRVVLTEERKEKHRVIDEIYQSFLEKDIFYLLQVKKGEAFSNLLRIIAGQSGQLVNLSELSSTLGLSVKTVKDYLWYLEKTFIIKKVSPYFKNMRKEITKAPIYYFYDLGLRNYAFGWNFGGFLNLREKGFLFQNFIFNILKEKIRYTSAKICFWRTKDGAEVDFVVDLGKKMVPIEVKYQELKGVKISRSLRSFIDKYRPEKVYLVNLSFKKTVFLGKTKVYFLPFWEIFYKKISGLTQI